MTSEIRLSSLLANVNMPLMTFVNRVHEAAGAYPFASYARRLSDGLRRELSK